MKTFPFLPVLLCLKKIGPGIHIFMQQAIIKYTHGKNSIKTIRAVIISNIRFIILQLGRVSGELFNKVCVFICRYNVFILAILFSTLKNHKFF